MKQKLLLSVLFVCMGIFTTNAQEYWFDEDFSSEEWQEAVKSWIEEWNGNNPEEQKVFPSNPATNVGLPEGTIINGIELNGAYIQPGEAELSSSCVEHEGETHYYGFRLRNQDESFIKFPQVKNAGKLYIHARNGNAANPTTMLVEEYDSDTNNWNLIETLDLQPTNDLTEQDEIFVIDLTRDSPLELRLSRGGNRFVAIYKIILEKNESVNIDHSTFEENIDLYVNNKTVYVTGTIKNATISIYDISGKSILNTDLNGNEVTLSSSIQSGTYIVKLVSQEGIFIKKISIK